MKAAVMHHAGSHQNPRETWRYLWTLKTKLEADAFKDFKGDVTKSIFPYIITEHGYKRSLASRDQAQVWKQIRQTVDVLQEEGIDSFANSGTLLGLIREGSLLPHDDDADLGILVPGDDLEQIVSNIMKLFVALARRGMISAWHVEHGCKHIALKSDVPVDLFPAWVLEGQLYAYPHGVIEPAVVQPLSLLSIEGQSIPVPEDSESFLELCYGPGWRTPDDTYRYPWGRAGKYFTAYNAEFDRQLAAHIHEITEPVVP
ncbi:LicD family protein [compost metagenome]